MRKSNDPRNVARPGKNGPFKGPSLSLNTSKAKPKGLNVTAKKP